MRSKLSIFCDRAVEAGWLAAIVVVPLFFNIYSQRVFEPDKISVLRSIALLMAAFWLIRAADDWRTGARSGPGQETLRQRLSAWQRIRRTPLALPTLLLVLVYLLSTALSVSPRVSLLGSYQRLQGTYTTLSYIVIFCLLLDRMRSPQQFARLVSTAIVVSFPIAMYGLVQHFGLDPLPWGGNVTRRVASNMGNAIFVAAYLIMVVPLTLSRLLENWREVVGPVGRREGILGFASFLILACALVTGIAGREGSGGAWWAWAALLAGLGLQIPIYLLSPAERRNRVLAISLPATFAFLVGVCWVKEMVFPPPAGAASATYLWLGILAALIFLVAMAAFAYYLRKPLVRLLLLAGYATVLVAQIVCILQTQSRGPLLGLLAGLFVYLVLLGLIKRQAWLPWLMTGLAVLVVTFLVVFNTVNTPLIERLRETPYVGRLGKVLQTEEGTGKVRILIWEGVIDMITPHDPLRLPGEDGFVDRWNALRPLIGYGPESMYVAYNRFYPADLAHYEKRNASPDRSHNETFDALAMTGVVGFLVYMFLFAAVFYWGLRWLGLMQQRWGPPFFLGLWVGGGALGAVAAWAWRGPAYLGVGIPGGMVLGLVLYLLVAARARQEPGAKQEAGGDLQDAAHPGQWPEGGEPEAGHARGGAYAPWLMALVAAIAAHFVEIHFGIAIAATRLYFWTYAALLVAIGTRLALPAPVAESGAPHGAAGSRQQQPRVRQEAGSKEQGPASRQKGGGRRAQTAGQKPQAAKGGRQRTGDRKADTGRKTQLAGRDRDWWADVLAWSLFIVLILGTLLVDYVTVQGEQPGPLATIWLSLTQLDGQRSSIMLVVLLCTWAVCVLVGWGEISTQEQSAGRSPLDWLRTAGAGLLLTGVGVLLFAWAHATKLRPVTITSVDAPNPLANTIGGYYLFVLMIVLTVALLHTVQVARGTVRETGSKVQEAGTRRNGGGSRRPLARDLALALSALTVPVAVLVAFFSNLTIIRADILYKQGLSSEKLNDYGSAVFFYDQAIALAPEEDFYYLFLGRALMEQGRTAEAGQRDALFAKSELALREARRIAPLNTDHSANLARLYRTWGGLSQEPRRGEMLRKALDYYVDATALSPQNAQILNEFGQTYVALGDYDAALQKYEASLALDARYTQTYLLLGELYLTQGHWAQAAEVLEAALRLSPNSVDALSSLGYVRSQQGDYEAARQAYERAVELRPKDFTNRKNLALIYQQLGRATDALLQAKEALAVAPEDQKATMQAYIGQLEALLSGLSDEDAQRIEELLSLGSQQMESEEWEEAAASFEGALALDPSSIVAHSSLAYVYARLGRVDEAIAENLRVLEALPDEYSTYKNLAVLYQQKGDTAQAIAAAQRALALAPDEDRALIQAFLDQLQPPAGQRAGDLAPTQREGMYAGAPPMTIDQNKKYKATIVTTRGEIVVDLRAAEAPLTVNNFVYLSRQGFYDGLTFHRVESQAGFALIQGGDPAGTGRGGPGYTIPAEIGLPHDQGAIAMARLADAVNPERASSGSQFYICLVPIHQLDSGYTVFGYVVEGLDVARQIVVGDKILRIEVAEQ